MAHPLVADEGQLQMFWINSHGKLQRVGPTAWELGGGITTPCYKKTIMLLQNVWNNLGSGKWTRDLGHSIVRSLYKLGSLETVVSELGKYNLDLMEVQEVRYQCGNESADSFIFFCVNRNVNHYLGTGFASIKKLDKQLRE
jgi:hypothetical protein